MTKINFDHHKGMFGILSMLKNIAEQFKFGDVEKFEDVKLFFLQGTDKYSTVSRMITSNSSVFSQIENEWRCWSISFKDKEPLGNQDLQ
ncbi:hypothetical protein RO3G_00158 [Rhizopus delemar RA 99-880]|uniref:Uncharacterized protein n=1 Tax=Rhizopus delemar (strain RA 99-880 / ATCC MYA-4621 / FGSC 9543 / NRRL 43880) TaxID=246409 RepID=I1BGX4_RHIO9|nr:hypothetical protein RO3G_00158 [Rhizopus delemar RA 99-880]|eukprot:EIE75454.1 hypothetical protein RO3G_00158 [Rhizopus delemar RA 99-880]